MGSASVLPSAVDAVYSLAGAAGRTSTYSDKGRADVSDNSPHFALSPVRGGGDALQSSRTLKRLAPSGEGSSGRPLFASRRADR